MNGYDATFLNDVPANVWLDVPTTARVPAPAIIGTIDTNGRAVDVYERKAGHVWQVMTPRPLPSLVFLLKA